MDAELDKYLPTTVHSQKMEYSENCPSSRNDARHSNCKEIEKDPISSFHNRPISFDSKLKTQYSCNRFPGPYDYNILRTPGCYHEYYDCDSMETGDFCPWCRYHLVVLTMTEEDSYTEFSALSQMILVYYEKTKLDLFLSLYNLKSVFIKILH
jgi:hypothetical protein